MNIGTEIVFEMPFFYIYKKSNFRKAKKVNDAYDKNRVFCYNSKRRLKNYNV